MTLCVGRIQEVQKRNLNLLAMTSFLAPCTQVSTSSEVIDVSVTQNVQPHHSCAGPAAGEMSLESSMTDDDSSHVNVQRPRHYRRHRGADDVFPTHLLHRYQVH